MSLSQRLFFSVLSVICLAELSTGCASQKAGSVKPKPAAAATPAKSTLASAVGKIASINRTSHFVVISYGIGNVPQTNQRLRVYRNNLKVGELKVTGPTNDSNTVADILEGEVQAGDEVRED